jgi:predicted DNA binding protein
MNQQLEEPYYVVIEVENEKCKGLKTLEDAGVEKYTLVDIRGTPEGTARHLIRIHEDEIKKMPRTLFAETRIDKSSGVTSAWFNSDGCDICNTIFANSSFLVSARHVKGYKIVYSFVTPNTDTFREIASAFEVQGIKFKVLEAGRFKSRSMTLTEKQERVLWLALKMGFFEYPRRLTMLQLSKRLGIGLSSLSEILRRGLRRLLEDYFKK